MVNVGQIFSLRLSSSSKSTGMDKFAMKSFLFTELG